MPRCSGVFARSRHIGPIDECSIAERNVSSEHGFARRDGTLHPGIRGISAKGRSGVNAERAIEMALSANRKLQHCRIKLSELEGSQLRSIGTCFAIFQRAN